MTHYALLEAEKQKRKQTLIEYLKSLPSHATFGERAVVKEMLLAYLDVNDQDLAVLLRKAFYD